VSAAIEERIAQKLHEFDLISLLCLLQHIGYSLEDIRFRSHLSTVSQPSLLHKIRFSHTPVREVVLVVNFGLLSAQSPLPSYFFKKMDEGVMDEQRFSDFMTFFDKTLIYNYLLTLYPELDFKLFPNWENSKQRYFRMLELKSVSTLHHLFGLVFPELDTDVQKTPLGRVIETTFPVLGITKLGDDAVFGKEVNAWVSGIRVTLFSDEEIAGNKVPWPKEIQSRLDKLVFPLLRKAGIDMEIFLVIRSQRGWAKLHTESYLGYDRIRGGEAKYRRIRIFRGYLVE
jgi:hypothetical protein